MTFWSPVRIRFSPLPGIGMVRMCWTSSLVTLPKGAGSEKPTPGPIVPE